MLVGVGGKAASKKEESTGPPKKEDVPKGSPEKSITRGLAKDEQTESRKIFSGIRCSYFGLSTAALKEVEKEGHPRDEMRSSYCTLRVKPKVRLRRRRTVDGRIDPYGS